MRRTYRIASRIIASGVIGILLIVASIYLGSVSMPRGDHPDVMDGWAAGLLLIVSMACALFLSGAMGMVLSFKDLASRREILVIPVLSGLATMILPFLTIMLLSLHSPWLFWSGLTCLLISLCLSLAGGMVTYVILSLIKPGVGKSNPA